MVSSEWTCVPGEVDRLTEVSQPSQTLEVDVRCDEWPRKFMESK